MVKCCIDGRQLQKLRKQVGLSEQKADYLLWVSRTILLDILLDILHNHLETIENLSFHLARNWERISRSKLIPTLCKGWQLHLKKLFGTTE